MNYYERHIGDYLKDTAHLSLLEHGVYTRLLDVYYTRESAIPEKDVARLVGARSKDEKAALAAVLEEFFQTDGTSWAQDRCQREILRYQDKQAKAKRSAEARWNPVLPPSDGNADAYPSGDASGMRSHSEGNAHQTPDTRHQKPLIPEEPNGSLSPAKLPTCPTQAVIDLYHQVLPNLPKVRLINPTRTKAIASLWKFVLTTNTPEGLPRATSAAEAMGWIRQYFERASANDFLMGRGQKSGEHAGWECDIDFLMSQKGMKHVIEKTKG